MSDADDSDISEASGVSGAAEEEILSSGLFFVKAGGGLLRGAASKTSEALNKASVAANAALDASMTCRANSVRRAVLARTAAIVRRRLGFVSVVFSGPLLLPKFSSKF